MNGLIVKSKNMKQENIFNRVVVITGASAGIGASLMEVFHRQGFKVVGLARRKERMEEICKKLNAVQNDTAFFIECDVAKNESVTQAFDTVREKLGRIDGVIANAGCAIGGLVENLTLEDYHKQFATNVFGVLSCFYAAKNSLENTKGFFTVIGSVNSYLSLPTTSAYAMSKFAIRAFCDSLYWETKNKGISITLVCPGFIETEIRQVNNEGVHQKEQADPIPRWLMMKSHVAAEQILSASIKRKREVTLTFHGKIIVFLVRFVPFVFHPFHKAMTKEAVRSRWNR